MPNDAEAAKAIAGLDGKEVGGRNLKVNEARPKTASSGPRGGGGGGYDRDRGSERGGERGRGGKQGGRFSNEDYRDSARQPREPRW